MQWKLPFCNIAAFFSAQLQMNPRDSLIIVKGTEFETCSWQHHTRSVHSYLMKNVLSWVCLSVCTKKSTAPLIPVFAPLINWVMVHVVNSVFHPLRGNCTAALIWLACHNRLSWASFPLWNNSLFFHIQSPSCPIILLVQWEWVGREETIIHEEK